MITYKVFLDVRRPKAGDKYPLMFRITFNRNSSNYSSGIVISKEHWNVEASLINTQCPNFKELNKNLTSKFLKMQKLLLQMEDEGDFTFEAFKERYHAKPQPKKRTITFLAFADEVIASMHELKRTGSAIVYQTAVNRLMKFCENKQLKFEQIDYAFLDKFKHQLVKDGVKPNTVGNYFRSIRALYNKAIKTKVVDRSNYPFVEISIKTEKTTKRAIALDCLRSLAQLQLMPKTPQWYARSYFFLSFSLIGMSFTDLAYLTSENIIDGRIVFKRRKTHKGYDIKISPFTKSIFESLNGCGGYLLPVLNTKLEEDTIGCKKVISQWIKTTNKWLKRIGRDCKIEHLTTYVARHSWATTAKRMGYSIEIIAEAMGHEHGNKITNIYLDKFDQSLIDEVNERVIANIL